MNSLVLTDTKGEDKADGILSALSELAYAMPSPKVHEEPQKKRRKSRFFFVLSESIYDEVQKRSSVTRRKELVPIDHEIEARLKGYRKEAPSKIEANIESVREFFLKEVGPLTMAGSAGAIQAQQVVQRLLNTEVDGTLFAKFDRMSATAANIKMSKFIARYYGLEPDEAAAIMASVAPKQPQIMPIPVPMGNQNEQRLTKESKEGRSS